MNPFLLLANEPTGNLATRTGIEIIDAFQTLNDQGITIVMVTHELNIAQYAQRNVAMRDGKILSGRPARDRFQAKTEMEKLRRKQQAADLAS